MSKTNPKTNTDRPPNLFPKTSKYFLFLKGAKLVAKVVIGVKFVDGEEHTDGIIVRLPNAAPVPLVQLSTAELRSIIATNLLGSFLCARAAFRVVKAQTPQSGQIINIGSVSAYAPHRTRPRTPPPNSAPYTATEHGITGFPKSLVLDGRAFNIACG
jgi:NAD(P)-dependent dehydrogenase (short-subunit alcohol dehydrogenase family)